MRVGILGLLQESNTFLPGRTSWNDFANDTLAQGGEIRDRFIDAPHEVGGFFQGLENAGIDPVPLFVAPLPYGIIDSASFARLVRDARPVKMPRHGSMAYWLRRTGPR